MAQQANVIPLVNIHRKHNGPIWIGWAQGRYVIERKFLKSFMAPFNFVNPLLSLTSKSIITVWINNEPYKVLCP